MTSGKKEKERIQLAHEETQITKIIEQPKKEKKELVEDKKELSLKEEKKKKTLKEPQVPREDSHELKRSTKKPREPVGRLITPRAEKQKKETGIDAIIPIDEPTSDDDEPIVFKKLTESKKTLTDLGEILRIIEHGTQPLLLWLLKEMTKKDEKITELRTELKDYQQEKHRAQELLKKIQELSEESPESKVFEVIKTTITKEIKRYKEKEIKIKQEIKELQEELQEEKELAKRALKTYSLFSGKKKLKEIITKTSKSLIKFIGASTLEKLLEVSTIKYSALSLLLT